MTVSPVMSPMISLFVPATKAKGAVDEEHQRIINMLKSLGITPTMDKSLDTVLLKNAIQQMQSQQANNSADYIPFADIMGTLNLTVTGNIDEDYYNTIQELDGRIASARDDEERGYYQDLKNQVDGLYSDRTLSNARSDLFIGASQIGDLNKFFLL